MACLDISPSHTLVFVLEQDLEKKTSTNGPGSTDAYLYQNPHVQSPEAFGPGADAAEIQDLV